MSLLKRIEKNQQQQANQTPGPTTPAAGGGTGGEQSRLTEMRMRRAPAAGAPARDAYLDLKTRVQNKLLAEMDPALDVTKTDEVRATIESLYDTVLADENIILSRVERQRLFEQIAAEILGFGPLEPFLVDETITEIMVNGPKNIYIERRGRIERTTTQFESNDHVMRIIDRIVAPLGRRIDESSPYVDARLPDGSRVNAIIPPLALNGPTITIRKFFRIPLTVEKLVETGSLTAEAVEFLKACVQSRLNILVSGGTGSGKTTLLNILSGFIPDDERIVTIENAAELQLRQEHVVTLESRPANIEGRGQVTIQNLVVNALQAMPAGGNELLYQVQRFHSFLWAGGGIYSDYYIHIIDHLCWLKNAWPVKAQAVGGRHYRGDCVDQNFDVYSVEYTFADGAKLFAFSRHMNNCWQTYADYAHGSRGSAMIMAASSAPSSESAVALLPAKYTFVFICPG